MPARTALGSRTTKPLPTPDRSAKASAAAIGVALPRTPDLIKSTARARISTSASPPHNPETMFAEASARNSRGLSRRVPVS